MLSPRIDCLPSASPFEFPGPGAPEWLQRHCLSVHRRSPAVFTIHSQVGDGAFYHTDIVGNVLSVQETIIPGQDSLSVHRGPNALSGNFFIVFYCRRIDGLPIGLTDGLGYRMVGVPLS